MKKNTALVADIGGTNVRFAIAVYDGDAISLRDVTSFRAEKFENAFQAVKTYLSTVDDHPDRGAVAAAGPVIGDKIELTNLPWPPLTRGFADALKIGDVRLVNDFYAQAAGVDYLPDAAFVSVKNGHTAIGAPQLMIGPGTGFGQAIIAPAQPGTMILATEAGHCSFGARNEKEFALLSEIRKHHNPVCIEHIVSGEGIANVYRALRALAGDRGARKRPDEIVADARSNADPYAAKALDFFTASLGRVAGDAVLATGAQGGVIISGGVVPKVRDVFSAGKFIEQFCNKGRMSKYLEAIPVRLVVDERTALFGAASVFAAGVN